MCAAQPGGAAHHVHALPGAVLSRPSAAGSEARPRGPGRRRRRGRGGRRGRSRGTRSPCCSDRAPTSPAVRVTSPKTPPPWFAIEHALAVVGDEQVHAPVVVVVAGADALAPAAAIEPRSGRSRRRRCRRRGCGRAGSARPRRPGASRSPGRRRATRRRRSPGSRRRPRSSPGCTPSSARRRSSSGGEPGARERRPRSERLA